MGRGSSKGSGGSARSGGANLSEQAMKAAQEQVTGLPTLKGSDKQIQWANNIRQNAFNYLNDVAKNTMVMGKDISTGKTLWNDLTDDNKAILAEIQSTRKAMKKLFSTQTSAKNIIDERNALGYSEIKKLVTDIKAARAKAKAAGQASAFTDDMIFKYVKLKTRL